MDIETVYRMAYSYLYSYSSLTIEDKEDIIHNTILGILNYSNLSNIKYKKSYIITCLKHEVERYSKENNNITNCLSMPRHSGISSPAIQERRLLSNKYKLTDHQEEICRLLVKGFSVKDIARKLGCSKSAVYKTVKRIRRKIKNAG